MKTELKQNCYLLARYDVDKNLELSQGCSTRQVSLKQHECETQVRLLLVSCDLVQPPPCRPAGT